MFRDITEVMIQLNEVPTYLTKHTNELALNYPPLLRLRTHVKYLAAGEIEE